MYTDIPNALIKDRRLSASAKGLICEIATYQGDPPGSMPPLAETGPDGLTAIRRMLKELERFGYLKREQLRGANGRVNGTAYRLSWGPVIIQGATDTQLSATGWAYAMRAHGSSAVKIGCSQDPAARLRTVQTGHPSEVRIIWQAQGGQALEAWLHTCFEPFRLRGEWFDFADRDAVRMITEAAADWAEGTP